MPVTAEISTARHATHLAPAPVKNELPKPCPWCGEDPPLAAQKIGIPTFTNYMVGCENEDCPANPCVSAPTVSGAWAKWNARRA